MAEILNTVECDVTELKNYLQKGARNLIDVPNTRSLRAGA